MAAVDALQGHGTTLAAHACHQIARHACPEPPLNSGRVSEHFLLEQTLARCVASTQPLHACGRQVPQQHVAARKMAAVDGLEFFDALEAPPLALCIPSNDGWMPCFQQCQGHVLEEKQERDRAPLPYATHRCTRHQCLKPDACRTSRKDGWCGKNQATLAEDWRRNQAPPARAFRCCEMRR